MAHPNRSAVRTGSPASHSAGSGTEAARERSPASSTAIERRGFLRGAGAVGAALAAGTGIATAKHTDEPSLSFPDGTALVLEKTEGPFEAAVRTKRVHMPEGGWVAISTDSSAENVIGHSTQRLPAGHFESLMVAVEAQDPGTYTLYATLFKGERGDTFPGDGPEEYGPTQDDAEITFE